MHAVFIPYGERHWVEVLLRHIEATLFEFPMYKGKKKKTIGLYGAIRYLPFGAVEAIFPREYKDQVLKTLNFGKPAPYITSTIGLRKLFKCKKVKKVEGDKIFSWNREHVSIIPVGFREDGEFIEPKGELKGWVHEAI